MILNFVPPTETLLTRESRACFLRINTKIFLSPLDAAFANPLSPLFSFRWVGQALIPSFVGDMKNPEDFPKALYVSMAAEFILFTITGAVVYHYAGTQYTVAPAYGSLIEKYGKVS